jgi:hypothetical protein
MELDLRSSRPTPYRIEVGWLFQAAKASRAAAAVALSAGSGTVVKALKSTDYDETIAGASFLFRRVVLPLLLHAFAPLS